MRRGKRRQEGKWPIQIEALTNRQEEGEGSPTRGGREREREKAREKVERREETLLCRTKRYGTYAWKKKTIERENGERE